MAHDIFISHSHADKIFADAICRSLEGQGMRCWIAPRDIRPSQDWAEAIINAMDNARVLVLIFSAHSNASPQVRREIERAVNKGLHVLPFRIENVPLSKSLEYFISAQHWLDAVDGEFDSHLVQLYDSIASLLSNGEPETPAPPQRAAATQFARPVPPASAPAPAAFAATALASVEGQLALVLGPIARHLVRRHAAAAGDIGALIAALALEIDDATERAQFVARCTAAASVPG
jgi:hypothetical protein